VSYFKYEWLEQFRNWYEGAKQNPSTNNALEAFNRYFKQERTLRERLPLSAFAHHLFEWIKDWSVEYDSGAFIQEPSLTLDHWTKGYQWSRLNKVIRKRHDSTGDHFVIPPGNIIQLKNEWIDLNNWESYDEFKKKSTGAWKFYVNQQSWKNSTCSCPMFQEEYLCKHIVGVALRLKVAIAPPEAKNIQIGSKRKRGRPAKAKQALAVQCRSVLFM